MASIGKDVLDFEDSLNRLAIQSGISSRKTEALRDRMTGLSAATGISRGQVASAATSLINLTGDIRFTEAALGVLTEANLATGTSMDDLAGLAFSLKNSFGIVKPEDLTQGLNALITAGKAGSIPLDLMASTLKSVAASFSEFKGTGVTAAAEVGVAMQLLGNKGFANAAEAGTGVVAMMSALKKKSKGLSKFGIKVFEKDPETGIKSFRTLQEIVEDFKGSKLAMDPEKLIAVLGRVEAEKALRALMDQSEELESRVAVAKRSNAIEEDAARRRQSQAYKLNKAWNDIKESIAAAFTPERIEKFVQAIQKVAELVGVILDNMKAAALVWAAVKFGPAAAGLALSAGGALGGPAAGAALAGRGAAGLAGSAGAGLALFAAGFAGWKFGKWLDEKTDVSDSIANFFHKLAPWSDEKVAEAGPSNRVDALQKRLANGEITQEEFDKGRVSAAETFAYRGTAAVTDLVGGGILKETGDSKQELQARYNAIGEEGKDRIREMARQVVIDAAKGQDTAALMDKIASAIQGAPIHVNIAGEAINRIVDKSVAVRTST